jgi:integrase/recombinase XerD
MEIDSAVRAYYMALDLTPRSQEWYRQQLVVFTNWLKGHTCELHPNPVTRVEHVNTYHMREYLDWLRSPNFVTKRRGNQPRSSACIHGYCRIMRAFLNWCIREEMLNEVVTRRFRMPRQDQKVVQVFSHEQALDLLDACDGHYDRHYRWLGERDRSIVYLLLDTGIRRRECAGLKLEDVRFDRDDTHILVHGKGRKDRECPLGDAARRQLFRYIHRFRPTCDHDYVFATRDRRPLDIRGFDTVISHLRDRVGFQGVRVSPHTFRHTFAFNYTRAGGGVVQLSRLLGHSNISTTSHYLEAFASRDARTGLSVLDGMLKRRGA